MINFEDAFEIVMSSAKYTGSETVDINDAFNRILAGDVKSDIDMPPFDKSAMDGFACRMQDLDNELRIIETIPAGSVPQKKIGENECSKIMTGAIVPNGADIVIKIEDTENLSENTIRFIGAETDINIQYKGEDVTSGEVLLKKGTRIFSQHVAILAAVGCKNVPIAKKPKVGIIATGSELVEPSEKPRISQIRNSNSYLVLAQLAGIGISGKYYGIARDTEEAIDSKVKQAISENDVVLLSGGVSMGEFDFVPEVLQNNGVKIFFDRVALKPGKPTTFGISDKAIVFGIPGNPVTTFVNFEILIKPFLFKMMEHDFKAPNVFMPLGKTIGRDKTVRESWQPVVLTDDGKVIPIEYHGSAHAIALCRADGLIKIPRGVAEIKDETILPVRLIK